MPYSALQRCVAAWFSQHGPLSPAERGYSTAVVALVSLIGSGAIFVSASLADGGVSFDHVNRTIDQSLARVGASIEQRGTMVAYSDDGSKVARVELTLAIFGEGASVRLDPAAPAAQRLVVGYLDDQIFHADVPYTATTTGGLPAHQLGPGDVVSVVLDLQAVAGIELMASERFTLELNAPVGGTVILSRRLPFVLDPVTPLR